MPYNTNIPQRLDFLSNPSQGQFLENFQQIQTLFQQDHVAFNDVNQGKHNKTTLTQQSSSSVTAPGATEYLMFSGLALPSFQTVLSLFFNSSASGVFVPGSYSNADLFQSRMSLRLPSGILIKWNLQQNITPRQVTNNIFEYEWNRIDSEEHFVTQYWAMVIVNQVDITTNAIFYVTDVSDPTKIEFAAWTVNEFDRGLVSLANIPLKFIAIGV